jgi:hypothetical protein
MSRASGLRSGVVRVADCGFAGLIFPTPIGIRARRIRARAELPLRAGAHSQKWLCHKTSLGVGDCTAAGAAILDGAAHVG